MKKLEDREDKWSGQQPIKSELDIGDEVKICLDGTNLKSQPYHNWNNDAYKIVCIEKSAEKANQIDAMTRHDAMEQSHSSAIQHSGSTCQRGFHDTTRLEFHSSGQSINVF